VVSQELAESLSSAEHGLKNPDYNKDSTVLVSWSYFLSLKCKGHQNTAIGYAPDSCKSTILL